jgi:hypothetical protein
MEVIVGGRFSRSKREQYSQLLIHSLSYDGATLREKGLELFGRVPFDFQVFEVLARKNKVLVRSLEKLLESEVFPEFDARIQATLKEEASRVALKMEIVELITRAFESEGVRFVIMKTLDNLPDLGHDIDLLVVPSDTRKAEMVLRDKFGALTGGAITGSGHETKSVCERLTGKMLFYLPKFSLPGQVDDYPEAEIYPRFSQLGEAYLPNERFVDHRTTLTLDKYRFYILSREHRLLISCLHSLFRHGIIRISELHNACRWITEGIDWALFWREVEASGAVAASRFFLGHVLTYSRTTGMDLPDEATKNMDGPDSGMHSYPFKPPNLTLASFWIRKGISDFGHGKMASSIRALGLAPLLAGLALARYKVTGKTGIW